MSVKFGVFLHSGIPSEKSGCIYTLSYVRALGALRKGGSKLSDVPQPPLLTSGVTAQMS